MVVNKSIFTDMGKPDYRIGTDLGPFFHHTAFDDRGRVHFRFRVNARDGSQNFKLIQGPRFRQSDHLFPKGHFF